MSSLTISLSLDNPMIFAIIKSNVMNISKHTAFPVIGPKWLIFLRLQPAKQTAFWKNYSHYIL